MGMKIVLNEPKGNTIVNFLASFSRTPQEKEFFSQEKKGFFSYLFLFLFLVLFTLLAYNSLARDWAADDALLSYSLL